MLSIVNAALNRVAFAFQGLLQGRRERGQGLVEYALIIALVAVVVIAALLVLGPRIASVFNNVNSNL